VGLGVRARPAGEALDVGARKPARCVRGGHLLSLLLFPGDWVGRGLISAEHTDALGRRTRSDAKTPPPLERRSAIKPIRVVTKQVAQMT
jgi:hypothetical protein